jgi:hypothetical protein
MARFFISALCLAVVAAPSLAVDVEKVNAAVKKGADYLKNFYAGGVAAGGGPRAQGGGSHGAGAIALSGMALLAAGVPENDASVTAIANTLRQQAFGDTKTYNVSLMILFFDKLGKPEDVGLIQLLGVKLISGQNAAGGWGYDTWNSNIPLDGPKWMQAFRSWKPDGRLHPEVQKLYQTMRATGGAGVPMPGASMSDDNSNTQFAVIAAWVAGRHAVPIRECVAKFDNRFLRTQDPQSGGWGYSGFGNSTPSMTCAGLLGLAIAFASKSSAQLEGEKAPPKKDEKGDDDDPFTKPPAPGADPSKPPEKEKPVEDLFSGRRKGAVNRGLSALGRILAQNRAGAGNGATSHGGVGDLYFYWSVERVGVAYNLEQIGGVDWYEWGAPSILATQAADGSWASSYGEEVGTSFAILFLTRANFAVDLTAKLRGKGFGGELRGGGMPQMKAIPFQEQEVPKAKPGEPPPKISGIREVTQADGLADSLVGLAVVGDGSDFTKKLKEYQAAKGEQYTAAITFALTRLERDKKKQAQTALMERLVRMTPETLKKLTAMNEPELRRAAILACAAKDDKTHLPDLIARINDPDEDVVKAARAGLRSLTGEDFGPYPGATDEEKQSIAVKWRFWLSARGNKGSN